MIVRRLLYLYLLLLSLFANLVIKLLSFKKIIEIFSNSENVVENNLSDFERRRLTTVLYGINWVTKKAPWRVMCYEQALIAVIVARLMGLNINIHFGLNRDQKNQVIAHSWSTIGNIVFTGGDNMSGFTEIYKIGWKSDIDSQNLGFIVYCIINRSLHVFNEMKMLLFNKRYREAIRIARYKSDTIHQITNTTMYDRYPKIFEEVSKLLNDVYYPTLLSYGCSTGEETESLRKYFPISKIVGADINKYCLRICKKRVSDPDIHFVLSDISRICQLGLYDSIFCMAVFQRTPEKINSEKVENLSEIYPFSRFEKQIIELDSVLKIGGYLIIHFSQYHFFDTSVSNKYKVASEIRQDEYSGRVFDKNGIFIEDKIAFYSIYQKVC